MTQYSEMARRLLDNSGVNDGLNVRDDLPSRQQEALFISAASCSARAEAPPRAAPPATRNG